MSSTMRLCRFFAFATWLGGACAPTTTTTTRPTTTTEPSSAPTTPPPSSGSTGTTAAAIDGWKARTEDASCQSGLAALAKSELAGFTGVAKCGRIDAEKALGDSGDQPSRFEQFGEYRVYKVGKESITVWFLSDDVRVVQTLYPKLGKSVRSVLGEPRQN